MVVILRRVTVGETVTGFPKPTPRKVEKARKRRHAKTVRDAATAAVFARDWNCRCCTRLFRDEKDGERHEIVFRSKLRGRPPEEIYNTRNCCRLCHDCHELVTHNRVKLLVGPNGADGLIAVERVY